MIMIMEMTHQTPDQESDESSPSGDIYLLTTPNKDLVEQGPVIVSIQDDKEVIEEVVPSHEVVVLAEDAVASCSSDSVGSQSGSTHNLHLHHHHHHHHQQQQQQQQQQ